MAPPFHNADPDNHVAGDAYQVSDADRGASFRVAPELGCNLCSWIVDGVELLFRPEGFLEHPAPDDSTAHLAGGNPVLFPAVGRTWDLSVSPPQAERYRIAGTSGSYRMRVHGLAGLMTWKRNDNSFDHPPGTSNEAASGSAPTLAVEYEGRLDEALREKHYPFDVGLRIRYGMTPTSITLTSVVTNYGSGSAPFALGFHPYFGVSTKEDIEVVLPCASRVYLDQKLLIPTGNTDALTDPVLRFDDDTTYDMAFGSVSGNRALIRHVRVGLDIRIDIDPAVAMFVVYSGARTPFICTEPWTRGLGGYAALGSKDGRSRNDLEFLSPGETREITIRYTAVYTKDHNGGTTP